MSRLLPSLVGLAGAAIAFFAAATGLADPPKPPAPYVLPWALRPIIAPTVVRSDNTIATYKDGAGTGVTVVNGLLAAFKIPGTGGPTEGIAPFLRMTLVTDVPSSGTGTAVVFPNVLLGAGYGLRLPAGFRFNALVGFTLPVGMGGGNEPDPNEARARDKGRIARASMENAIYSVNDLTVLPALSLAYVDHGLTLQVEATLLFLARVRGELKQPDVAKTNLAAGFFAGYFVVPKTLSLGLELRYQRWIAPPKSVDAAPDTIDNLSLAGGVRYHVEVAKGTWLRCGVSYGRGLDDPLAKNDYNMFQVDCPLLF